MIFFFSRKFVEYGKEKNIGLTTFSNAVHEAVFGIKEIKILNLINFFKDKVNEGAKKAARAEIRLYLFSIVPRYLIETMLVAIICLILLISFYANDNVLDTIAILSVFLVAALRLLPSISLMISAFNAINLDIDAINKLDSELSSLPKVRQDPNQNSKNLNIFDEYNSIELSNINFGYHETELVIKDLSLQIQRGDFIGLLGESGQGKTTMIDLILGINFPKDGTIKVDGLPIFENLEAWRSLIAYLPQETFIVSGTIAENVALGLPKDAINEDKIITAIQKAGLKEFLESLPQGIHTPIGERGLNFSGGQRQRIALARAFYSNRQIFILDESTSALDKDAAQRIIAEMNELTKSGITIILISHNMVNLSLCNRKLRLNQGRLQELPN
jgi:ABC-type bacteriocin/lantibiotic exporter with double-glycine peptidase domain